MAARTKAGTKGGAKAAPKARQRRTWQRLPAAVRKTSIIWGFIQESVMAGSIEGASLRGAADRARCTTPLVYHLFGSRQELVRESVRWTYRTVLENLERLSSAHDLSARQRLDAIAGYVGGRDLGEQEIYEAMIMLECRSDPKLAAEVCSIFSRIAKLLEVIIREGIDGAEFQKGIDAQHVAWRLTELGISRNHAFLTRLETVWDKDHLQKAYDSLMREIESPRAARAGAGRGGRA